MHSQSTRTALFIDGPNLCVSARKLGFEIDFKRLLTLFSDRTRLIRALYYTSLSNSVEFQAVRPLIDWLDYNGFTVVTKPAKEFFDGTGARKMKTNMRVELAVDALKLAPQLDQIVLFSGDSEFLYLVAALKDMGKRVSVVSTLVTEIPMIADDLRRKADVFFDLSDLQASIGRPPKS